MDHLFVKFLPQFIREKLEGRHVLQKTISNTGWLFADKVTRMGVGLFVSVWIARYLGPEQFGLLNYAIAFVALFSALASLGLDGIVIRNIVRDPLSRDEVLGTAFILKLIGSVVAFLLIMITIYALRPHDSLTLWMVGIIGAGLIFQAFDSVDLYFQSQIKSKYSVVPKSTAFFLISALKIVFILANAPLIAFAWAGLAEIALGAAGLLLAYKIYGKKLRAWKVSFAQSGKLFNESWPLILSGLAVMIYMRIDQVMLGEMIGEKAVGLYSAATRISESLYFIPMALTSSIFPSIVEAKKLSESMYHSRLQSVYILMTWLGLSLAIIISFLSNDIIGILFGSEYVGSAIILSIYVWSGIFVYLGMASGQFLITEHLTKIALYRTGVGAIINVTLNIILIPAYGPAGAAFATLIAYACATFFLVFIKKTRTQAKMMLKSFLPVKSLWKVV